MHRPLIAGVMGLALAGCAHSRPDVAQKPGGRSPIEPVGLKPVPSLSETINRGTGNAALAQTALRDPNDPRWTGQAPSPDAIRPAPAPTEPTAPAQGPRMAASGTQAATPTWSRPTPTQPGSAPDPLDATPGEAAIAGRSPAGPPDRPAMPTEPAGARPPQALDQLTAQPAPAPAPTGLPGAPPNEPLERLNPAPDLAEAAAAAAEAMPPMPAGAAAPGGPSAAIAGQAPAVAGRPSPASPIPYTLERPGGPMPGMLARPSGPDAAATATATAPTHPAAAAAPTPDAPPGASDPNGPGLAGPAGHGLEPVGAPPATASAPAPADAAVSPSAGPAPGAGATRSRPNADPLLGPNPDLMPELPPLPGMPAAAPAAAPASPPAGPADAPASPGASAPAPGPGGLSAPPELGPPSADHRPAGDGPAAGAVQLADLPPLEPVPSASQLSGGLVRPAAAPASPVPVRRATARRDGQIIRTSLQKPAGEARETDVPGSWRQASMTAAKVGDEIITMRDLQAAVNDFCKRKQIPYNDLARDQKNDLCGGLMKELIHQSLLLQEAKRIIKDPKMFDKFAAEAERFWREDQIPQLKVEYAAEDEAQLREKLKEHGRSFETIGHVTKRAWMADAFLHEKLKGKIKAELPELLKYYNEHMRDRDYDRPAQITWREIVVDVGPKADREAALRKIQAIHESLRRGAPFAAMARAQSEGPSRSREQGGLMQTSPGSYGVAAVNQVLDTLSIGQVSGIIEGPSSFHIVRVDGRRAAGPAPFEELQDQIRSAILEKRFQAERAAYLQKLWDENFVTTFLDQPDPRTRRASR